MIQPLVSLSRAVAPITGCDHRAVKAAAIFVLYLQPAAVAPPSRARTEPSYSMDHGRSERGLGQLPGAEPRHGETASGR